METRIVLSGCDDTTEFVVDLTEEELRLVKKLSDLSEAASDYGCQPILKFEVMN